MNTPNENTSNEPTTDERKRPDRTQRAAFWLRTIELRKDKMAREYRKSLRSVARDGVSDEEYAAMLATLEKMARNLGWDESQKDERPFGRGRGRGFGPDHGFGFGHGHGQRHPGMMRGFGRKHPRPHDHDHTHENGQPSPTDAPQA